VHPQWDEAGELELFPQIARAVAARGVDRAIM
jgi:hypothetical protein